MTKPAIEEASSGNSYWYKHRSFTPRGVKYRPLPYYTYGQTTNYGVDKSGGSILVLTTSGASAYEQSYARAYDKFVSRAKGELSALMMVNLAERKQAIAMIAERATQLYTSARAFTAWANGRGPRPPTAREKRRANRRARYKPQLSAEVKTKRAQKELSSLWLEYHFGWEPLLNDIYQSILILQDVPQLRDGNIIVAAGSGSYEYHVADTRPGYFPMWKDYSMKSFTRLQGRVWITNPNAYVANQLGLVNPALLAWELVPFSFVIDWFLPVGRFLESYTDLVGWSCSELQRADYATATTSDVMGGPYGYTRTTKGYLMRRTTNTSLSIPSFTTRSGTGIKSIARAATAIALLSGFLKSH